MHDECMGGVVFFLTSALLSILQLPVTWPVCDAKPTVTCLATVAARCHATGTKLYCMVREAHVCE